MMNRLLFPVLFLIAFAGSSAQSTTWQPSPGHKQLPIWPGVIPHAQPLSGPEFATNTLNDHLVAGKPWTYIENVTRPTITVYSPTGKNTGAAVVVFPGGGYHILAIDLEGSEVCDWLMSKGITCVLLKYRVPGLKHYAKPAYPKSGPYPSRLDAPSSRQVRNWYRYRVRNWRTTSRSNGLAMNG